jgi:hypothetical protein
MTYPEDVLYNLAGKGILYAGEEEVAFVLPGFSTFLAIS